MMHSPRMLTALLLLTTAATAASGTYSPGGWPTLHEDAGNRRAVDVSVADRQYRSWSALSGAATLTAPVTSPDGGQLYVTTGQGRGNSNLHAYSVNGELLWQATPWQSATDGVDPCAILSSPIVDSAGDIYLSDCNQLFAFHSDGSEKWTIALPPLQPGDWVAAGAHPVNAFTTAAFTADGNLLGVTNFGDVLVVNRIDGSVLNQPFRLPAALAPYAETVPMPDSLLSGGLMDPDFREWAWQLIFGGSMRSANTPAVSRSNRIFIVGNSANEGIGALYGLDLEVTGNGLEVRVAFATEIGIGSGSSPALSPAEERVYVSDEEGWFYGIDTSTGNIEWKVKTTAAAGAAAVGDDGTVYALQSSGAALVALTPQGQERWHSDLSPLDSGLPDSWLFGAAVPAANGNPTVTADAVLVPVLYGYDLPFLAFNLPVASFVVAIDLESGKGIRLLTPLVDDSSGITAVLADGTLVNSLGAVLTSALAPAAPVAGWLLPQDLAMLPARGGIQVSAPVKVAEEVSTR